MYSGTNRKSAHSSQGWRKFLEIPGAYNFWQRISGAERWKRRIITDYVCPFEHARILEVGCGTGTILNAIPENLNVDYAGCDINSEYIQYAREHFQKRGRFFSCGADNLPENELGFDFVIAIAIFHHLDDAMCRTLVQSIKRKLKSSGIFILAEPVWTEKQSALEKYLMGKDRGQNIRTESGYHQMLNPEFPVLESKLVLDSHRIPWTVNVITCR